MPRLGSNSRVVSMVSQERVFICTLNQVTVVSVLGMEGWICTVGNTRLGLYRSSGLALLSRQEGWQSWHWRRPRWSQSYPGLSGGDRAVVVPSAGAVNMSSWLTGGALVHTILGEVLVQVWRLGCSEKILFTIFIYV